MQNSTQIPSNLFQNDHHEQDDQIEPQNFNDIDFDEEISPVKVFEPRSAGLQKKGFLQFGGLNSENERQNPNDFTVKKNLLVFKDF